MTEDKPWAKIGWVVVGAIVILAVVGSVYDYLKPQISSFMVSSSLKQYQGEISRCAAEKQNAAGANKVVGLEYSCAIEVAATFYSAEPEKAIQLCLLYNPIMKLDLGSKKDAAAKADEAISRAACKGSIEQAMKAGAVEAAAQDQPKDSEPVASVPVKQPTVNNLREFSIPEAGVKIEFPKDYGIVKNTEANRRGSFVSYDFSKKGSFPLFNEIQFFSPASIEKFAKNCSTVVDVPCFMGDYPTLNKYNEQKIAFNAKRDYSKYQLKKFNDRYYFTSNFKCDGDSCSIREYTTFIANAKIDIWVTMENEAQISVADKIFGDFKIIE
jgi:hypothetical protein